MTDLLDEVERVAKLCEKATPGEWFCGHGEGKGGLTVIDDGRTAYDSMHCIEAEAHDAEAIVALRNLFHSHGEELLAAVRDASLWRKHISKRSTWRREFEKAPCFICGYNGAGYYQPDTHKCAEQYHAAMKEAK